LFDSIAVDFATEVHVQIFHLKTGRQT